MYPFRMKHFYTIEDTEKCESTEKLNRDMPYSLCALCLCVFVVNINFNRIRYTTARRHCFTRCMKRGGVRLCVVSKAMSAEE